MKLKTIDEYTTYVKEHSKLTKCPIRFTLESIGGKWKLLIVLQLFGGKKMRFGELKKNVEGITNTMLSNSLRELEESEIVIRTQYNEIPPRVEYMLTKKGESLSPVLLAMANWGLEYEIQSEKEKE